MNNNFALSGQKALRWLEEHNYEALDDIQTGSSNNEFNTGGNYGVELPVVNNFDTLQKTVRILRSEGVYVTRFNETHSAFLLCNSEIQDMLNLCSEEGFGITFGIGLRPEYDRRATFYRSAFGLEQCRQVNNHDALRASLTDAIRLAELGCRGLIVYDLGVLRLLNIMRKEGALPKDMVFKASSHCMITNAIIGEIYAENGADGLTVIHDVGLPMLYSMRKRISSTVSLDVPIDTYRDKGGFIRFHEVAEIVQVAAPVFLKIGASIQNHPYQNTDDGMIVKRVNRIKRALEILEENFPMSKCISSNDRLACKPALKKWSYSHYENHNNFDGLVLLQEVN